MARKASGVEFKDGERGTLLRWIRSGKTERRFVERANIILLAGEGKSTKEIAEKLKARPARVSKWRRRFAEEGLKGLQDGIRSGRRKKYGEKTEKIILGKLDEPPPEGYGRWTGRLLGDCLGINKHHIWKVLRAHGIYPARRRSWCVSTDPEFSAKAADVVGLYLDPPENAVVICVDKKPSIQALERTQGWLKLPNGKALTGFNHEYKRHGTTTLFGALEVATGMVKAGHYNRKRRREFLHFMNEVVKDFQGKELHVILDNLSTHKPKNDRWLKMHPQVHFHHTPTHASWLNQIECWFSILSRNALKGRSSSSVKMLRETIDKFIQAYNKNASPFEWKKRKVYPVRLKYNYANL